MNQQKIWLLLDSSKSGGIESHVQQLAEGLHQHGEKLIVIFLSDYGKHPMRDLLHKKGVACKVLDGRLSTLYTLLVQQCPSILHTHGYKAGIFGRLAAWLTKTHVISTYHAGEIATGKLAVYDWVDRITAVFADHVVAVSPQIAKRLPGKIQVFDNFVNTTNIQRSTGQQIAFVGRVSAEKGPDYFVYLAIQLPHITFHLYGDGPLLAELEKNSPTNLYLHGQQDEMNSIWSQIGLLVIPSRYEGLPMAALEAMARGIPVLAFRVGALNKLIENDVNGWLIEAENIALLAKKIDLWCALPKLLKQKMQLAAQATIAQRFSSEIAIPKLIAHYRKFTP